MGGSARGRGWDIAANYDGFSRRAFTVEGGRRKAVCGGGGAHRHHDCVADNVEVSF